MTEKYDVEPEQAIVLEELEELVGKTIPIVEKNQWDTFGVKVKGDKVVGLGLHSCNLRTLPESIGKLSSLQELDLNSNKLTTLPESIGDLSSLETLNLQSNQLSTLPESIESIGDLSSLETLNLQSNQLSTLPESIGNLKTLEVLSLWHNQFSTLPESITKLKSLQALNLRENDLTTLPESIGDLKSLKYLDLYGNKLATLSESITNLSSLKELNLKGNQLTTLPESIGNLSSLKELYLKSNKLSTLPESISNLKSLQILDLSYNNKLSTLPESIGDLSSLQTLNLSVNQISTLPESISKLKSLEKLVLERNQLSTLPESIGDLSSLKRLNLSGNIHLSTLPESIGNLSSLKDLSLKDNQLTTLPESFWRLKALTSLDLNNNPWDSEWKGIENDTIQRVLELCRQRAPITVFVSHSRKDEEQYLINGLKQYLKERKEVREVRTSGAQEISESQLLLFVATENSIVDEQCRQELELAVSRNIPIVPIKATDITWEALSGIDLGVGFNMSEKLGFELEFDSKVGKKSVKNRLQKFYKDLYEYIKKYKRVVNLFKPEERAIDEQWLNVKIISEKFVESEEFGVSIKENLEIFRKLYKKLISKDIAPEEYILKTGQIFNSKKS